MGRKPGFLGKKRLFRTPWQKDHAQSCLLMLTLGLIFFLVIASPALAHGVAAEPSSRENELKGETLSARILDGDTLFYIELDPVEVVGQREFSSRREERRYNRLERNVRRVYPYAQLAGSMFREYGDRLLEMETERERRQFIEEVEEELLRQFGGELRRLTFSQGVILIKLVDRETRHTSYEILREFRGLFSAVFWQSLGRLFGYNLKTEYDPEGEDQQIEEIVQRIEQGLF